IVSANDKAIVSFRDFQRLVASAPVGTTLKLEVIREGKTKTLSTKVGARPSQAELAKRNEDENSDLNNNGVTIKRAGMEIVNLTPSLRTRLGVSAQTQGVVISSVNQNS